MRTWNWSYGGLNVVVSGHTFNISGLFIAVIVGVVANLVLPNVEDKVEEIEEN